MAKLFLFVFLLAIASVLNVYIFAETNLYGEEPATLFILFEVIAIATLVLLFSGLFVITSFVWTFFNIIIFNVSSSYTWVPFVVVQSVAIVFFFVGICRFRKEGLECEAEEQRQLDISAKLKEEGKEAIGTISSIEHVGGTQNGFEKTYKVCLTVDVAPSDRMPFTCQVTTMVPFYDLATYRPGSRVKIVYMHDDPEVCEFVAPVDGGQPSLQPKATPPRIRPVVCSFCQTHFDLSDSAVCPNCRAPYVN